MCHGNEVLLVFIAHRQVGAAFGGHGHFGGQSSLQVGQISPFVRPVDFAGGLHFGPRCRVKASQFDEGEHGGFDTDLAGGATRNVLLFEGLADGDASSDSGQWETGGFGHEGDGPGGPRVDLEDVQIVALDGELNVEAPLYLQAQTNGSGLLSDAFKHRLGDVLGGNEARGVARVNAGLLQMFHDGPHEHFFTVGSGIDVNFSGVPKVFVHQQRFIGSQVGLAKVAVELLLV